MDLKTLAYVLLLSSGAVVAYTYIGYPILLKLGLLLRRKTQGAPGDTAFENWPMLSITVPAYNEEASIAGTLDALLALDYPADRLHILVISDASTDRTDEIVRGYANRGVDLVRLPERKGKTAAENAACDHIRGSIVVNTDAAVRIHPSALKPLIRSFSDPSVGIASGRDVSIARGGADPNIGESGYVGYDMWVRDLETQLGGIVGASGCFYASRRDLHRELVPEGLSRDFAAPLIAWEHGYRSVSVREAVCFVPRAVSLRREFYRKIRTMARGLQTLTFKRHLLNPRRHGLFAWKLLSRKVARWLVPWAALLGGLSLAVLALGEAWARWVLAGGLAFVLLAIIAWYSPERRPLPKLVAVPGYLFFGLTAGIVAWIRALRGDGEPIWEPTRREPGNYNPATPTPARPDARE